MSGLRELRQVCILDVYLLKSMGNWEDNKIVEIFLILDVEDVAGAAGGEVECVQEDLPGQAEHHQLVVQILLAALGDLTWPRPRTLGHAHTLAHPDHLLVVRVLLLHRVHNESPLQLSVPRCPRSDK